MLSKKFIIALLAVIIVAFIGFGIWLGSYLSSRQPNPASASEYSAVYLSTGDIYYGILSWFPLPRLTNVWSLQRSGDQNNPQIALVAFKNSLWGPVDEIRLNPKQIIFWTRLRNDSQVLKAIRNPDSLQPQAQQPAASPAPTSTLRAPVR
ncbi:MAG: hypothetical protein HY433_03550 [Candidatus Liptonbacteria bacterium]|nr:hypothetical protein [Candidatus Liptonbacteria bacterium]